VRADAAWIRFNPSQGWETDFTEFSWNSSDWDIDERQKPPSGQHARRETIRRVERSALWYPG